MNNTLKIHNKTKDSFWKGMIVPLLIFLCFFAFLAVGVGNVASASDEESRQILQDAMIRATVQCYAIEGMYPPDIQYLVDNYGIVYDHDRFIIHYEVFAGNILPDITVLDVSM